MAYPAGHGRARAPRQLNLGFDGKREPVTRCLELVDGAAHLSFDTVPWRSPEQGQRARALCDGCGAKNCLQTAPPVLSRPPANPGLGCADRRRGGGGVLRPTFLSADVQGCWGASKTIKYTGIAERLNVGGYPTKVDELKNARRTAPVAGAVPDNRCACNRE